MKKHSVVAAIGLGVSGALALGVCLVLILNVAGFGLVTLTYAVLIGLVVGLILLGGMIMATNATSWPRELVKQIIVWLGIVVLLPLSVWYGTCTFGATPNWKDHQKAAARIEARITDTKEPAQKEKLRDEKERLDTQLEEAERVFYGTMFWVAYPIGLAAIIGGILLGVQAVGAGLLYGGVAALVTGCYSYWNQMEDGLRFSSLVVLLAVVTAMGLWRFRPAKPEGLNQPMADGGEAKSPTHEKPRVLVA